MTWNGRAPLLGPRFKTSPLGATQLLVKSTYVAQRGCIRALLAGRRTSLPEAGSGPPGGTPNIGRPDVDMLDIKWTESKLEPTGITFHLGGAEIDAGGSNLPKTEEHRERLPNIGLSDVDVEIYGGYKTWNHLMPSTSFQFEFDKPLETIGVNFRSATLIPGNDLLFSCFCLATAYNSDKQEYDCSLTGSSVGFNGVELPPIAFLPQDSPTNRPSPLSDLPPSDVELDLGSDNKAPGGRKREREEDSGGETEPAPRRVKDVTPALALRRSNRRQAPPHQ
ncbi:hypothetical protein B0H14DRAFT_2571287 [Mycena olivaceomarginata]|nr:hypothetical protein B0H14DRAFT_2571287 [Mycena olivaceomarginata]